MFVYSSDLSLLETVTLPNIIKEGWGICNDGVFLYISDGTSNIYKISTENYSVIDSISVYSGNKIYSMVNELEWADGDIWANFYFSKYIAQIDAKTGNVKAWVDLTGLETNEDAVWAYGYVLNGIAFYGNKIYVTGKCWKNIYEIELVLSKFTNEPLKIR